MLVLSRKVGETIVMTVGDVRIVVFIESQRGKLMRVCVDAPQSVQIKRGELEAHVNGT
jgi:carbon storage regulator CsrA